MRPCAARHGRDRPWCTHGSDDERRRVRQQYTTAHGKERKEKQIAGANILRKRNAGAVTCFFSVCSVCSVKIRTGPKVFRADISKADRPFSSAGQDRSVRSMAGHEWAKKIARYVHPEAWAYIYTCVYQGKTNYCKSVAFSAIKKDHGNLNQLLQKCCICMW